jgi:hypothetical protein
MSKSQQAEIIDLDSEDDVANSKDKDKKKGIANCINFKCSSGVDMKPAPSFTCSFFGVNMMKKKKRFICKVCLDIALDHQEVLYKFLLMLYSVKSVLTVSSCSIVCFV